MRVPGGCIGFDGEGGGGVQRMWNGKSAPMPLLTRGNPEHKVRNIFAANLFTFSRAVARAEFSDKV